MSSDGERMPGERMRGERSPAPSRPAAMRALLTRWQGVALSAIGIVAVGWLAATGRLGLYIHPRYIEFTVVLAAVAAVAVVAAFAVVGRRATGHGGHDHNDDDLAHEDGGHAHDDGATPSGRAPRIRTLAGVVAGLTIIVATAVTLLVLPPSSLTAATATQREVNSGSSGALGQGLDAASTDSADAADYAAFTVKDWSTLLRQGADVEYLAGRVATVEGFVTADESDPENVFYLARFVVTCCAVDAQPVGLAVYEPGWQDRYDVGSWWAAEGGFVSNPSVASTETVVLEPTVLEPIDEPAMPYVD